MQNASDAFAAPPPDVLGILGGMGPAATADFLSKLTKVTAVECDQDHLASVVCCFPDIPDRTEAILSNGPSPLPFMLRSLALLKRSGANRVVIPCNTAHHWFDELQRETDVPIIHIVDAVQHALAARGVQDCVGLLATSATVRSGIYTRRLEQYGTHCILPREDEQACVMNVIRAIKAGRGHDRMVSQSICSVVGALVGRGARTVILACTELPLVMQSDDQILLDSTEALACECLRTSRNQLR